MFYIWLTDINSAYVTCTCCDAKFFETVELAQKFAEDRWSAASFDIREYNMSDWCMRERNALSEGVYTRPIWYNDEWHKPFILSSTLFCHVGRDAPKVVHYFENDKKGAMGRTTSTTPGRFLKRFYGDILTEAEIKAITDRHREAFSGKIELKWASTPDEIEAVYTMEAGFSSCMQGPQEDWGEFPHPVRAYGAGDLQVAYIHEGERLLARALVWKERNLVGRVYGDAPLLRAGLKQEGIETESNSDKYDSMIGARLLQVPFIPDKDSKFYKEKWEYPPMILPYLDGTSSGLIVDGAFLKITPDNKGQYQAANQEAFCVSRTVCPCCGGFSAGSRRMIVSWPDAVSPSGMPQNFIGREYQTVCYDCATNKGYACEAVGEYISRDLFEPIRVGSTWAATSTSFRAKVFSTNYSKSSLTDYYHRNENLTALGSGEMCSMAERDEYARMCIHDGKFYKKEDMVAVDRWSYVYSQNVEAYKLACTAPTETSLFGPPPDVWANTTLTNDWLDSLLTGLYAAQERARQNDIRTTEPYSFAA